MTMRLMNPGEHMKPGGWYFFVACKHCQGEIIFAKAPSFEEEARPMVRGGIFSCAACGKADTYQPREVRRGQAEQSF